MKHRKTNTSSFGLKYGPRKALLRSLIYALVQNGRIKTTLTRAKNIQPLIEKAITLSKKATLHARRILLAKYPNKDTVFKLQNDLAKRFKDRPSGCTRIVKLGQRPGDQAKKVLIEFVDHKLVPKATKEEKDKLKASKETQKARQLAAKKRDTKRKTLRTIQKKSRKINR